MSFRGVEFNSNSSSDSDSDSSSPQNIRSRSPISFIPLIDILTEINNEMTQVLKPEYLKMVPEFHGETELLPRFIDICEKLVTKFYNTADVNDFQNEYLMSSILAKIKGDAILSISSCIINNWADLKTALVTTYGDKRDMYTLNVELVELKQGNDTPFEYFNKIQNLLNLQTTYITIHSNVAERQILIQYIRHLALRVLLRGLKDPIGSLMRTKNPPNLNAALHMLTNDFQIESTQRHDKQNMRKPSMPMKQYLQPKYRNYQPPQVTHSNNSYSFNAPNNNSRPNNPPNNYFNNNQRFQQPSTSNNHYSRVPQTYKPTPMSITTRNTQAPSQNLHRPNVTNHFRNSGQKPNFVSEELYNIDDQTSSENVDDSENVDESEFFQEQASESQISN